MSFLDRQASASTSASTCARFDFGYLVSIEELSKLMKTSFSAPKTFAAAALGLAGVVASGCNAQTAAPAAQTNAPQSNAKRPNVLLILADDVGWSDLGCMGGEIHTPNLDALSKGGLTFTQFYNSARCSPTRASLLTGLTPHAAGVANIGPPLSNRAVTLPEVLAPAGYTTSMVGKWHLTERSTPVDRGFADFYGMLGGFNSYWQEHPYFTRLPEGRPTIPYKPGEFYSTNAFTDYSIDFLKKAQLTPDKPWFQYLAYNAAHFPLHAPEKAIAKYEAMYAKGWDAIRAERLERQKKLGLVEKDIALTPRSVVPKNFINVQTGWADKQNPAWDSLPADRRADLARRMATYAATIDLMDESIGHIVAHLKKTGQFDNTLIFFLSDNGACAEWDPFGFDKLDSPLNILHQGEELKTIGTDASYVSYGSGWANASNAPWRLYKHYAQEGGIRTPLIVHWPAGLKTKAGTRTDQPGEVADFMPTLVQLCGATYPTERNGVPILPVDGESIAPILQGQTLPPRILCMEHEGNRMVREQNWKLVAIHDQPWELYDLSKDPTEMHDLATAQPQRVQKMEADWTNWAEKGLVIKKPSPQLVNKALKITCEVTTDAPNGVILAQGGLQRGYALHLQNGKLIFSVRQNEKLYTAAATETVQGHFAIEARLEKDGAMTLAVDGKTVARGKAPGVFTTQPQDELSIGLDALSAVGEYQSPNALKGKVENVKVETQ